MSLLNAALRKKDKEGQPASLSAIFTDRQKTRGKLRPWIYLLVCLGLAMGLAVFFGLNLLSSLKNKTPLSTSQIQPVPQKADPAVTIPVTEQVLPQESPTASTSKTDTLPKSTPRPFKQVEKPSLSKNSAGQSKKSAVKPKEESPKNTIKAGDNTLSGSLKPNKPDPSRVFYEKAVRYHQQNRLKEAILMYQQVLSKNPLDTDTLFNLAAAYLQNRDFSMALPILKDLSEKDPNNPQVLLNLAIAEMGLGEPDLALSLLDKIQQISAGPTFELYFHKAAALSQLGRLDEAKHFYEMAGKINPENSGLLFNLAVLNDKMGQYKEALEYYRMFLSQKSLLSEKEKEFVERRVLFLSRFIEIQ